MENHADPKVFADDLPQLIHILPQPVRAALEPLDLEGLLEVVLDLGRPPEARFLHETQGLLPRAVTREDLDHVLSEVGEFGADNRAGIERTLHRISAIRNRKGQIVGLTLRVGRAVAGSIDLIRDLLERGAKVLLVGRPGVGKTTLLREATRVLSDDIGKRVMVVDTSNEIAGDGDVPHPAIGSARRMQVTHPTQQHAVMIEAVENHMPEAVVVDEIGTLDDALAARTIAERGVQLIGTAHGNTLENLVANPTLSDLIGGIQTVTLGDEEARFRGTQKTVNERRGPPTFDAVVEIVNHDEVIIHGDTAAAVDALLRGDEPGGERRSRSGGEVRVEIAQATSRSKQEALPRRGPRKIYPYGLSRDSLERAVRDLGVDARVVTRPEQADVILALRSRARDARLERLVEETGARVHWINRNGTAPMRRALQGLFHGMIGLDEEESLSAVEEAEEAAERVLAQRAPVELSPRHAALRKLQHLVASRHHLPAESVGREPARRLVILPP